MVSSLSTPPILAKPFAINGDKTDTIPTSATGTQAASLDEGFPEITSTPINEGGIPPQREDFNGLGYLTTSQFFYLQMGGRFTFNSAVSNAINGYPQGAVLQYTDPSTGQSYEVTSLIPNNTYNFVSNPSYIDGVKWRKSFSENLSNYMTYDVLSLIYPIGSIYIGTQATCPLTTLISGSTWTKVATKIITGVGNVSISTNNKQIKMKNNEGEYAMIARYVGGALNIGGHTFASDGTPLKFGTETGLAVNQTTTSLTVNIWRRTA